MAPRYFTSGSIYRPTIDRYGDRTVTSGQVVASGVRMSIWDTKAKDLVAGGELVKITAVGFLPSGTNIATRDVISGVAALPGRRFEVLWIASGVDDRGRIDHVGVQLREIP